MKTGVKTTYLHLANRVKHCVFRHYILIAVGLFGLSLMSLATFASRYQPQAKFMIIGVPFSFVILVQQQKLGETRLFKELFAEFNARYDSLNEDLNRIRTDTTSVGMSTADRDVLYNYFNLCAEEYFYFSQGYILENVWHSWTKGMEIFFACPRIHREWVDDPGSGSYYGFVLPK